MLRSILGKRTKYWVMGSKVKVKCYKNLVISMGHHNTFLPSFINFWSDVLQFLCEHIHTEGHLASSQKQQVKQGNKLSNLSVHISKIINVAYGYYSIPNVRFGDE